MKKPLFAPWRKTSPRLPTVFSQQAALATVAAVSFLIALAVFPSPARAERSSPQFQRLERIDSDVAHVLLNARLAMRDLAECNLTMLARLDRLMSRYISDLTRYQNWVFNLLLRMARQLNEILTDLADLMPSGPNPALEGLKAGLAATGLIPGVGTPAFVAGLIVQGVEGWANAHNAAQAAGIGNDILERAGRQVAAFNDAVSINNDIAGALRELERYQKQIQELIETYEERCGKQEEALPGGETTPTGPPQTDSWRKVAKNVVDQETGQPLDGARVTLIPKDPGRTITPIDRATPQPGDTIIVSAPCHEQKRFVVGRDPPPERLALKAKPIRYKYLGIDCDSKEDQKRVLKRLAKILPYEGIAEFDPKSVKFHKKTKPYPHCEVLITKYRKREDCWCHVPTPQDRTGGPTDGSGPGEGVIEGDYPRHGQAAADFPNDPYFQSMASWGQPYPDQWALRHIGFQPSSRAGSLWPQKADPVIVAVIDTGVDRFHPDLMGAVWVNEDEIPDNGLDDDGNGFVDDRYGWNFVNGNNDTMDNNGHGTVVAGVIAAGTDNALGIAGVNPWAVIMPVKATDFDNSGGSMNLSEAICYAVDNGARVLNISIGGKHLSRFEQLSIDYAGKKGAVVVVAAGNEGVNTADFSPAGLRGVITVAATDTRDRRVNFSNWGAAVDIAAPGVDVLSLRARSTDLLQFESGDYKPGAALVGKEALYYRASGSSFSAPFVAGAASLILSARPHLAAEQVTRMLLHSARDIETPGWDQYTGYGLLDVRAALAADPEFFVVARITSVKVVMRDGKPALRVSGSADADRFARAWIEAGQGKNPNRWRKVSRTLSKPVKRGVLDDLKADPFLAAKQWTLRLIAEHANGRRREARYVLTLE